MHLLSLGILPASQSNPVQQPWIISQSDRLRIINKCEPYTSHLSRDLPRDLMPLGVGIPNGSVATPSKATGLLRASGRVSSPTPPRMKTLRRTD
jgi:hypothetical protein